METRLEQPMNQDFDVLVIGGGTAGLVVAAGVAGLGGKVALAESNLMGGDCLNFGCVPSKALIASSRAFAVVRQASRYGIVSGPASLDFNLAMARMREIRNQIAPNDSVERFQSLGVRVFQKHAKFIDPHAVLIGDEVIRARRFVVATGSSATIPNINGLKENGYFTNETIFDRLDAKPTSLMIIGGGPIACELAQVFSRMGIKVLILQHGSRILSREDEDAVSPLASQLALDGVEILTGVEIKSATKINGMVELSGLRKGEPFTRSADCILVAAGRQPRVTGLGLELADVRHSEIGIEVNEHLMTSQPHIFAAGDVLGGFQFTHCADYQARIVVRNLMMPFGFLRQKANYSCLPWVTYTSPEIARVGMNEEEAKRTNVKHHVYRTNFEQVDRAILDGFTEGFVKILTEVGSDKILGATIVGHQAGELLSEIVLAMQRGIGLGSLSSVIHSYPTLGEGIRKTADNYNKSRLKPWMKRIFQSLFSRD